MASFDQESVLTTENRKNLSVILLGAHRWRVQHLIYTELSFSPSPHPPHPPISLHQRQVCTKVGLVKSSTSCSFEKPSVRSHCGEARTFYCSGVASGRMFEDIGFSIEEPGIGIDLSADSSGSL